MHAGRCMFGHVLRLDKETPAQLAMDYYVRLGEGEKEPLGRPDTTLPVVLFSEYKRYKQEERGGKLYQRTKDKMLEELRELAKNKAEWGVFVSNMYQFLLKE